MATTLPSEFRLIPARAGLNAVADPQRRNIQAGTAILNLKEVYYLMSRVLVSVSLLSFAIAASACASSSNSNVNQAGNGNVAIDANNLPPGLSASPIPPSSNSTPGIPDPANANQVPKGATPTPGIPGPDELRKPAKPGATPTPGIPSPEELRRQLQRNVNVDVNRPATSSDSPMMMKRKDPRPVNKP